MVFGGPQILDCYIHIPKPSKIYSHTSACGKSQNEDVSPKKNIPEKSKPAVKISRPPAKKAKKDPLPIAAPNSAKKPGRPKRHT